ncbi:uncharacterized protein PG986_014415 [Apiospora aurea]|uniref:Zn(2)-C6 fungal-type domain-containing protein n=1 Tax=Apiospora aurea TaxID=335848 RepID=A0ABR1PSX3_9PEZI
MERRYAPILPATKRPAEIDAPSETIEELPKRKRIGTQSACNRCRAKKTRCDGVRPVCGPCSKRSVDCVYVERKRIQEDDAEVLELLQSVPEERAIYILRLFRTTGDSTSVLTILKSGIDDDERHRSLQGSRHTRPTPDLPRLELELMAKNAVLYPPLLWVSVYELEGRNLLRPLHLHLRKFLKSPRKPLLSHEGTMGAMYVDFDSAAASIRAQAPIQQLPKRGKFCDERIRSLDIGSWTKVPIPSEHAAKIISLYIETDHPLLGTFDPDLFISDLVRYRNTFCSSLMVNALLYWGCQMYTAIDEDVDWYTDKLGDEAERLWEEEKEHDLPLNVVSAQLLSLAFMGRGKGHKVLHFLAAAVQMGIRLGLFGVDDTTANRLVQNIPESLRDASSFIAWGVFNWTFDVTFLQEAGYCDSKTPPILPIPRDGGTEENQELRIGGAVGNEQVKLRSFMGVIFTKVCEFWLIVHEVPLAYHESRDSTIRKQLKLDFAEKKYREILAWAENLPPQLIWADNNQHHVIIFYMWIHSVILDIFRPLVDRQRPEKLRLRTFSAPDSTASAAYTASVNQLKQLIIHFRSKYESSTCTMLWHTALMYVANAVLQDTDDPQWHEHLLLCIYGYERLCRPFRVAVIIARGLLTMTLRKKNIKSEEARNILGHLQERGLGHVHEDIRATFMGDLELAQTDPQAAAMEKLAGDFEDTALFQEFIHSGSEGIE